MKLEINFSGKIILIELCDTPIVRKWIDSHKHYISKGEEYKAEIIDIAVHSYPDMDPNATTVVGKTMQECVNQINNAIDNTNSLIKGKNFPFRAYMNMPWDTVNKIHRSFTLGELTKKTWEHNFTPEELRGIKVSNYEDRLPYLLENCETQFEVVNKKEFIFHLEDINQGVHKYETFLGSTRALESEKEVGSKTTYIELDWDNNTPSGHRKFFYGHRTSFEELQESFKDDHSQYDVFIGKMITGKDYEFAYCEYDNGLEFDITNIDWICGDIRLHYNNEVNTFYRKGSYTKWINDLGIQDSMHLPVPLGKIIKSDIDFVGIGTDYMSEAKLTNGNYPLKFPFNKVTTRLIED